MNIEQIYKHPSPWFLLLWNFVRIVTNFFHSFETSDGTQRQEQGEYKNDTDQQGLSVKGSYKYVAPDGQHVSVTFIADKNGYQPTQHVGDDQPAPQS